MGKRFSDWHTWILHGVAQGIVWLILSIGFSPIQCASLLSVLLLWWADREEAQDGYRKLDDYLDLIGPIVVTIVSWIIAI